MWNRLVTVALALVCFVAMPGAAQQGIEGIWQGTLSPGAVKLRLVFHVSRDAAGALKATMDSIDQGANGFAFDSVEFVDGKATMVMKRINGVFSGTLNADGASLNGTFTQGSSSLPLNLTRTDTAPTLARPQEPKPPFPYKSIEVAYDNPIAAGVRLGGTLTVPEGEGPFPAVLMITGSGPQDRDEALMGHKPFLVISDHFTRQGIAVLRVDDRGVGASTGDMESATSEDFASDVLAGVAFLKTRDEVDDARIGLVGHSEGGLIAPVVATRSDDVAFIVLMAGPGVNGEEILYEQAALIVKAMGAPQFSIDLNRRISERMFAIVKEEENLERAKERLKAMLDSTDDPDINMAKAAQPGLGDSAMAAATPWMRHFLLYDPRPVLAQVTCPVLAVYGEKDLQVPPLQNGPEMRKALETGGNKAFEVVVFPGLNHLFQPCTTGSPQEYGEIEQTIAPEALKTMTDWIVKHTAAR